MSQQGCISFDYLNIIYLSTEAEEKLLSIQISYTDTDQTELNYTGNIASINELFHTKWQVK